MLNNPGRDQAWREQPPALYMWLRRDLSGRYGTVVREDLPQDMLAIVGAFPQQD